MVKVAAENAGQKVRCNQTEYIEKSIVKSYNIVVKTSYLVKYAL